jgi:hypothetical protein
MKLSELYHFNYKTITEVEMAGVIMLIGVTEKEIILFFHFFG